MLPANRSITIRSFDGPHLAVLDGGVLTRAFTVGHPSLTPQPRTAATIRIRFDGLSFVNGRSEMVDTGRGGGAVLVQNLTPFTRVEFASCRFESNEAIRGGAVETRSFQVRLCASLRVFRRTKRNPNNGAS